MFQGGGGTSNSIASYIDRKNREKEHSFSKCRHLDSLDDDPDEELINGEELQQENIECQCCSRDYASLGKLNYNRKQKKYSTYKIKYSTSKSAVQIVLWLLALVLTLGVWMFSSFNSDFNESVRIANVAEAWSGSGTDSSPYIINDLSDLTTLKTNVSSGTTYSNTYFKLNNNITISSSSWNGIGTSSYSFEGTFDGNGHIITLSSTENGVFAYAKDAIIQNLGVDGTLSASDTVYAGTICGYAYETNFTNCWSTCDLSHYNNYYSISEEHCGVGGLVGCCMFYCKMVNCWYGGELTVNCDLATSGQTERKLSVGGLIGLVVNSEGSPVIVRTSYCLVIFNLKFGDGGLPENTLRTIYNVGQLVGRATPRGSTTETTILEITDCFAVGTKPVWETTLSNATSTNVYLLTDDTSDDTSIFTTSDYFTNGGTTPYQWSSSNAWNFENVWYFTDESPLDYPVLKAFAVEYDGMTITFDARTNGSTNSIGGNASVEIKKVGSGESFTPDTSTYYVSGMKSGWTFKGWSESANSTTLVSGSLTISNDKTLYAVYQGTLTAYFYQLSSTTSTSKSTTIYNNQSASITAPTINTNSDGWSIVGWGTSKTATSASFKSGATATITNGTTYYAIYTNRVQVTYTANGGSGTSMTYSQGSAYFTANGTTSYNTSPAKITLKTCTYTKSGCNFLKWAVGSTSGTQYSAGETVSMTASATLYAIWSISMTLNVTFSNTTSSDGGIVLYIYKKNSSGGYDEFYTYYFSGTTKTHSTTVNLTQNGQYTLLVSKPYTWTLGVIGSNITNGTLTNNKYTFTTSSSSGTISVTTSGGTPPNTIVVI